MAWYHEIRSAARALRHRDAMEGDLDEEMRFHLEMEARALERTGLSPEEARRRAVRRFGGVERYKDEVRDETGTRWLDDLRQDLRFGWRALRRRRGFTAIATLTLALGIGVTTALFGVVKSVLLAPLPYGGADRIAVVWSAWKGFDETWLSYDEWEGYRAHVKAFQDVGLFQDGGVTLGGGTGAPERLRAGFVTENVFRVLGVTPVIGRGFTAEEDRPDAARVVVLGYDVWQRRFGGDPAAVGRTIEIGGRPTTVVGVMPAGFQLPLDFGGDGGTQLWVPLATDAPSQGAVPGPEYPKDGMSHGFYAVARLAPGATLDDANRQLGALVKRLGDEGVYPPEMEFRAFARAIDAQVTGRVRPALLVLFAAVGLVLLIACANVAGLLLVRGEDRRRELAVRVALGGGGRRLTRMLLAESLVLAALGGTLGVLIAWAGVWLVRRSAPAELPRVAETSLDAGVLLFALGVAVLAAVLAGLLPAVQATRVAPALELRDGGRASTVGAARLRWRQSLVIVEIALAVVLVAGAGLMVRSVRNLFAIDAGFRPEGVLTMSVSTPSVWYGDSARVAGFWDEVQRRVAAIPGVHAVGAVRLLPLADEMGDWGLRVEGYTPPPHTGTPGDWQVVTPGYFEAMGLQLVRGRFLQPRDGMTAPLAMIVNERFVRDYVAGREPLGVRVRIGGGNAQGPQYTIVGVVRDVRHNALTREVKPQFYAPLSQFAVSPGNTMRTMTLAVRTTRDPQALVAPVRTVIEAVDPRLPVSEVRTMPDVVAASIAEPRFAMGLLGAFGALALTLSAVGVFGIVSQVVASRQHEFGIRAALGASPSELVMLGVRAGALQAVVGVTFGVALALGLTRTMRSLLHGVAPTDPVTFATVVAVTSLVAVAASVWPARRAGRADPATVLHEA